MRVSIVLSDIGACGTYRMIWPAQAVKSVRPDWEVNLHPPGSVAFYTEHQTGHLARIKGLPNPEELDLIVLQRVGKGVIIELMRRAQAAGCAVVLDNDDAMWAIDRRNSAWAAWNNPHGHHWRWTDRAAQHADLCSSTTSLLSRRYGGASGRSVVVPNFIPELALFCDDPAYDRERDPVVGWSGQIATHPKDPQIIGNAVARAVRETGCRVAVQPDADVVSRIWGVSAEKIPSVKLGAGYFSGLRSFDVALVPLEDSVFNRSKSALKALECAAAGCAVIASPTPANRDLAKDLPILLADRPDEWHAHIVRLINDPAERRERGEQARQVIRERWTFESQGERWAEVWERAVVRRRRLTPREVSDACLA